MKAIIDGKRYDTDTAVLCAEWNNNHCRSDFKWCNENLYRTHRGAWFLHGEGGAMSPWSQSVGDMRGGGAAIRPLTPEDARLWLEEWQEIDALEEFFAEEVTNA